MRQDRVEDTVRVCVCICVGVMKGMQEECVRARERARKEGEAQGAAKRGRVVVITSPPGSASSVSCSRCSARSLRHCVRNRYHRRKRRRTARVRDEARQRRQKSYDHPVLALAALRTLAFDAHRSKCCVAYAAWSTGLGVCGAHVPALTPQGAGRAVHCAVAVAEYGIAGLSTPGNDAGGSRGAMTSTSVVVRCLRRMGRMRRGIAFTLYGVDLGVIDPDAEDEEGALKYKSFFQCKI
ncbi:hypothetical protein K438DRAFT_2037067 [Mycena galopus ATCC 62051]|nr:hypothetical protein K438DRAFT_2037067 [Mycena galopus ATCC 62051]